MEYDNKGEIALWGKRDGAGESAPVLKGSFYAHRDIKAGEQIDVALWRNESKNPKAPILTGKVSDKRNSGSPVHDQAVDPEEDIPF